MISNFFDLDREIYQSLTIKQIYPGIVELSRVRKLIGLNTENRLYYKKIDEAVYENIKKCPFFCLTEHYGLKIKENDH